MAKKSRQSELSFASGFVQSRDVARVIASIDSLRKQGEPDCWLMKWGRAENKWLHFDLEWSATRMWVVEKPELMVFSTGPEGRVSILTLKGSSEEVIDSSDEGPGARGHIRDLRGIGDGLYVCGMGRQVYRRDQAGRWSRFDQGMVVPLGETKISGLNSIDGMVESDIYAVGFGGEIWRCLKGVWHQMDTPTNVMLNRVRAVQKDLVFACGQKGVLIRGKRGNFEVVPHDATRDQLWGMEWFKERLYVSSEDAIYVLDGDSDLRPLDLGKIETCGHLHANDGVLWSFGTKHIAWTEDAKVWHDVTP